MNVGGCCVPVGVVFEPGGNMQGQVVVSEVVPLTQAAQHPKLLPGLILKSVGEVSVVGMEYQVTPSIPAVYP